ncbi:MAG: cell wall hydrolase [Sphingomonadaceae bacterium]|nr:cell wall hydrolase [Sphingomonadaceae bacterium]
MSRKTQKASIVAIAATLAIGLISAQGSGANAQQGENQEISGMEADAETVPVFVSEEVVQDLPPVAEPVEEPVAEAPLADASSLQELIAVTPTDGTLSPEMECLAGAIYFESRGEPLAGQLAVGRVIVNRAESDDFPSSYCGVVYQRKQFSFVRGGRMPAIPRSSAAWHRAKAIAQIAHHELWDSEAKDSLYFHARYVRPAWSKRKVARATISTHIFYR